VINGFMKPRPSAQRSMAQIKNVKGYPLDLILAVGSHVDGSARFLPQLHAAEADHRGAMVAGLRELKLKL
jgi:hypothetical protein